MNKKPLARGLPHNLFAGLLITTTICCTFCHKTVPKLLAASMLLSITEGAHASVGADYTCKTCITTTKVGAKRRKRHEKEAIIGAKKQQKGLNWQITPKRGLTVYPQTTQCHPRVDF